MPVTAANYYYYYTHCCYYHPNDHHPNHHHHHHYTDTKTATYSRVTFDSLSINQCILCWCYTSGAQIPSARSPWRLKFVRWRQMLVAPDCRTSFVSPIWRPEFWDGSQTDFGKVCAPVVLQIVLFTDLLNCPDCGSLQSTLSPHPSSGLTTIPSSMLHR